jgi:hypothetical protein
MTNDEGPTGSAFVIRVSGFVIYLGIDRALVGHWWSIP